MMPGLAGSSVEASEHRFQERQGVQRYPGTTPADTHGLTRGQKRWAARPATPANALPVYRAAAFDSNPGITATACPNRRGRSTAPATPSSTPSSLRRQAAVLAGLGCWRVTG